MNNSQQKRWIFIDGTMCIDISRIFISLSDDEIDGISFDSRREALEALAKRLNELLKEESKVCNHDFRLPDVKCGHCGLFREFWNNGEE